jgi:hypothetical protein
LICICRVWLVSRSDLGKLNDGLDVIGHWLAFTPSIEAWLAERMRIVRGPASSPVTHRQSIQSRGERPLTPEVFLIGRDLAKKEVLRVVSGELRELRLQTLQPREAVDFVVAIPASENLIEGASLSGRTVLVYDGNAWKVEVTVL